MRQLTWKEVVDLAADLVLTLEGWYRMRINFNVGSYTRYKPYVTSSLEWMDVTVWPSQCRQSEPYHVLKVTSWSVTRLVEHWSRKNGMGEREVAQRMADSRRDLANWVMTRCNREYGRGFLPGMNSGLLAADESHYEILADWLEEQGDIFAQAIRRNP